MCVSVFRLCHKRAHESFSCGIYSGIASLGGLYMCLLARLCVYMQHSRRLCVNMRPLASLVYALLSCRWLMVIIYVFV